MRRGSALLLSAALLLLSGYAAADVPRIALVREPGADPAVLNRLRAELDELGLQVVELGPENAGSTPSTLDDVARQVGAFAAIRLVPSVHGAEVWVADRVTGKTMLREVVVAPNQAAGEVVALRAVELLRVSLLELQLPDPPQGDAAPTPALRRLIPETSPRPNDERPAEKPYPSDSGMALRLGPAFVTSPGGLGTSFHGLLGVRFLSAHVLDLELFGVIPTLPVRLESRLGSADVSFGAAGAAVNLQLTRSDWSTRLGLGYSLLFFRLSGSAEVPYRARTETVWSSGPVLRAEVARRLYGQWFLGLETAAGVALPRPVVSFAGQQVAAWGRPYALAALTFGAELR